MQLNANHAKEFVKLLGCPELHFEEIDKNGLFKFELKEVHLEIDPGTIAGLIHLSKGVSKGETPEEVLKKQVEAIRKELGIK